MALSITNFGPTVGTSPWFVVSASTTKTDQTDDSMLQVHIGLSNMTASEQYRIRLYEKINGVQVVYMEIIKTGSQSRPVVIPGLIVGEGWEIEITKLAGTDRVINVSLRKAT
jgi:hypothetical protein